MARKDLSTKNFSDYAAGELEYVLTKEKKKSDTEHLVSVEEAMAEKPIYQVRSTRDVTRVLFISTNIELLDPTRQTLDGYVNIADLFDEVHVLVLRIGIRPKNPVLRASENVWIYTAAAKHWWELPAEGMRVVEEQLSFASGFRPDLIVARDPIESALLAKKVAAHFKRPTQLHIIEDFSTLNFVKKSKANYFRRFVPYFTIKHFPSVRTLTDVVAAKVAKRFAPHDLKTLPRLQNYEAMITATTDTSLATKYRGLSVFLLYIGELTHESGVFKVIESARFILRNQRIGLIIIGDGPARGEIEKLVRSMHIQTQVVIERTVPDLLPYLKGSHMLLVPDDSLESEEVVLKGAATGTPLLIAPTEKRTDIFIDKVSAYFINPNSVDTITTGISDILNNVEGRALMAKNAQDIIKEKFHFDPKEYQTAYRLSIEEALFIEPETSKDEG